MDGEDLRIDGALVLGGRVAEDGWVLARNGRIEAVGGSRDRSGGERDDRARGDRAGGEQDDLGARDRRPAATRVERLGPGSVLAPGLMDIHIHGGAGVEAMTGPAAIRRIASALAIRGVTSFVPTAVSASLETLAGFASDVATARHAQAADMGSAPEGERPAEARILGANLEGPAIDPAQRGAHDPAFIVDPAVVLRAWRTDPSRWTEVRIVTLAPERPGGLELVRHLEASGVVVSIGHTGATFDEAIAAYEAGARSTTHLFNRMTGLDHHEPGVVGAALVAPRAAVELIADGVHVDRRLWPFLWRALGSRLVLVSDAMAAAGSGDGVYRLGSLEVTVRDGRATTADGALAGSTISVADAVANLVAAGLSLSRAVAAATSAPARLLRCRDLGRLRAGGSADLVVLDRAGRVERTMVGGRWVARQG
jgi:N-acetylglucosamine-6-phosphate deacetylase